MDGVFARFSQRRLGVTVTAERSTRHILRVKQGVLVSEAATGSAAEMAGLRAET